MFSHVVPIEAITLEHNRARKAFERATTRRDRDKYAGQCEGLRMAACWTLAAYIEGRTGKPVEFSEPEREAEALLGPRVVSP